jgi:predicted nucleic acid-binding protein
MAGARTDRARRILGDAVLGPFARRGRIVAPTAAARRRTGEYLSHLDLGGNSVGRQSDALLASQARELGWVVVTRDRDFESLRAKITGLRVAAPYPER